MENKTLQDFTTEKLSELTSRTVEEIRLSTSANESVTWWMDVAERYAAHVAEQACRKQRELCAYAAKTITQSMGDGEGGCIEFESVDKDSILNAPLATENKL